MPSITIKVDHPVGLHARPAAEFVKKASKFNSDIQVQNITSEGDPVNAKSILSVLTLGVNQGHEIKIDAEGTDASEALKSLSDLVDSNFGEELKE